ncbi:MAG: hypothetical protein ACK5LY_07485 [Lachnospirales bacterium]
MKKKLLEILLTYNKFATKHNEKIIDLRNELFHELKVENIEILYEELKEKYCIVSIGEKHEEYSGFIFSFVSQMTEYDVQSKDNGISLKRYLAEINKSELYYYRNILYHEITSVEELYELGKILSFNEVLQFFDIDIDSKISNKLVSYYNQRYEAYYIAKGYKAEHVRENERIDYVVYSKGTPISGITTHVFTHKDAKFYSVNISNYNHSSNIKEKVIFKDLNTDLYFDVECNNEKFYIKLNYYVTECPCPILISAVYDVKSKKVEHEKLFIPFSAEYEMFENKGDIFKDKSPKMYFETISKIKKEFKVYEYQEFWKILKPIAHKAISDVESMKAI